ncbi:hypothetical protein LZ318_32960 [Saccharopolyspora indica]|uniref:hypothetical protein n=1 Tax=Saccharopolyspora indica TaxID=1229659 RepID=UPI0022EB12BC|nr:hypothetical protein [Saccharopolyspora indica]MDA3643948.1 hypothetical protein [Saccharopolyspora indica]
MKGAEFAGTAGLVRLILRRDRLLIPLWLLLSLSAPLAGASGVATTYSTAADRRHRFEQVEGTPMFVIFQGRAFGDTTAALSAQQGFATAVLIAALGAALLVARHTRGEEAAGRRELLGSTVTGRHAPLAAVMAVIGAAGIVITVAGALALIGFGLPVPGSFAMGSTGGAAAWLGAAFAAVAAQLTTRSVIAGVSAAGVIYAMHFLRGVAAISGDSAAWSVWLIPNGWLEEIRPYTADRWWPLALAVALSIALVVLAARLSARRDIGGALLGSRPGPVTAPEWLRSDLALALRLHRPDVIAFSAFLLAMGLALGAGGSGAMAEYGRSAWVQAYAAAMLIDDPADALYVYVVFSFVFVTGIHAVLTVLRLHRDETSGIAANLLGGPLGRVRWALGQLAVAMAAPVVLQFAMGLGLGLGTWAATGRVDELGRPLALTMPLVIAVWVIVAIAFAAFGLRARTAPRVGWTALAIGIAVEIAVKAGSLPEWLYRATSPFASISPYFQPTPLTYTGLLVFTAVLVAVGSMAIKRRDLATG